MNVYKWPWRRILLYYLLGGAYVFISVGTVMVIENNIALPKGDFIYAQYYATGVVGLLVMNLRVDYEHIYPPKGRSLRTTESCE